MDKLVVLCHAIHGDGTVNAYIGPDTPKTRSAISALNEEYGDGMFQIPDTPAHDFTDDRDIDGVHDSIAVDFIAALSWWGSNCEGEREDHHDKARSLLAA